MPNAPLNDRISPMAPPLIRDLAWSCWGWRRNAKFSITTRPRSPASATRARASSAAVTAGFSTSTCLPARSARAAHPACSLFGSGM
jgi:hypothetical protein